MTTWATRMAAMGSLAGPVAVTPASSAPVPAEPASEVLAAQVRAGCLDSFAALVARHGPAVHRYLSRMTSNAHDAEDLTQETFVKALRALQDREPPQVFVAWLFTIARRTALNHFRGTRAFDEVPPDARSGSPDPATDAAVRDDWVSVWRCARGLRPEYYEVLWLRYGEGLDMDDIARITRRSALHVRVLLHRARRQLLRMITIRRSML